MARRTQDPDHNGQNESEELSGGRSRRTRRIQKRSADEKDQLRRGILRFGVIGIIAVLLITVIASLFLDIPMLNKPRQVITALIRPMQEVFSSVTGSAADYLRKLKLRYTLEERYTELLQINEDLRNENARLSDYENQVNQLYDLLDEKNEFQSMSPLAATVIGHDTGSYFSMLQLNVGSHQGVKDYMAVISGGGLVGYTYDTEVNSCKVRCIIDSQATVAGMLQLGRDQGSVSGTLGIDGQPMCRMYYLPESSLPRPGEQVITSGVGMEFPRGLPIGTVRESTRSLDDNKAYIVLEPIVDFGHIEHVIVLLYQPSYAEDAESRGEGAQATLVPLSSPRPVPTFQNGIVSGFNTPAPTEVPTAAPSRTPEAATPTPGPESTSDPDQTPRPTNIAYVPTDPDATPTPSPTPVPTPTPTPMPTFNPNASMEEEE